MAGGGGGMDGGVQSTWIGEGKKGAMVVASVCFGKSGGLRTLSACLKGALDGVSWLKPAIGARGDLLVAAILTHGSLLQNITCRRMHRGVEGGRGEGVLTRSRVAPSSPRKPVFAADT